MASSSRSSSSARSRFSDRPVLPPIRDLFRELAASNTPPESPAVTLARLRLSDDEDLSHCHSRSRPPSRSDPYRQQQQQPQSRPRPTVQPTPPHYDYPGYPTGPQPYYGSMPPISTAMRGSAPRHDDEDRTPIARYQQQHTPREHSPSKFECNYCGKGFTRPSSLKIHINSHTGEKPFVCPVEGCSRRFSVLSNMRRHARGHANPMSEEGTSEEGMSSARWTHHRRLSSASGSSSGYRSGSVSSDDGRF